MGNSYSQDRDGHIRQLYNIIRVDKSGCMSFLEEKATGREYLLKEFSTNSNEQFVRLQTLLKNRQLNSHPQVLSVYDLYSRSEDTLCSHVHKIYMIVEHPFRTLYDEIDERRAQQQWFTENELWSILYSCSLGLQHLYQNNRQHQSLSSNRIYIENEGLIKISDPELMKQLSNINSKASCLPQQHIYLSPEQLEAMEYGKLNNQMYSGSLSDVFTLGMIMLQASLLDWMDKIYENGYISPGRLHQTLDGLRMYSQTYRDVIKQMLKLDPRDRIKLAQIQRIVQTAEFEEESQMTPKQTPRDTDKQSNVKRIETKIAEPHLKTDSGSPHQQFFRDRTLSTQRSQSYLDVVPNPITIDQKKTEPKLQKAVSEKYFQAPTIPFQKHQSLRSPTSYQLTNQFQNAQKPTKTTQTAQQPQYKYPTIVHQKPPILKKESIKISTEQFSSQPFQPFTQQPIPQLPQIYSSKPRDNPTKNNPAPILPMSPNYSEPVFRKQQFFHPYDLNSQMQQQPRNQKSSLDYSVQSVNNSMKVAQQGVNPAVTNPRPMSNIQYIKNTPEPNKSSISSITTQQSLQSQEFLKNLRNFQLLEQRLKELNQFAMLPVNKGAYQNTTSSSVSHINTEPNFRKESKNQYNTKPTEPTIKVNGTMAQDPPAITQTLTQTHQYVQQQTKPQLLPPTTPINSGNSTVPTAPPNQQDIKKIKQQLKSNPFRQPAIKNEPDDAISKEEAIKSLISTIENPGIVKPPQAGPLTTDTPLYIKTQNKPILGPLDVVDESVEEQVQSAKLPSSPVSQLADYSNSCLKNQQSRKQKNSLENYLIDPNEQVQRRTSDIVSKVNKDGSISFGEESVKKRISLQNSVDESLDFSSKSESIPKYVNEQHKYGSRYEGYKLNDKRHGFGKFYYQDGGYYEGEWKHDKMDGYAKLYYQNGEIAYEGYWKDDQFHGRGKVFNDSPDEMDGPYDYTDFNNLNSGWLYYDGMFDYDKRTGLGTLKLSNGQIFQGCFVDDVIEGPGKFYTMDGEVVEGMWKQSKLIEEL